MYYILNSKDTVPIRCKDMQEWALLFKESMRRVAFDRIDNVEISTVFLGIDHSWLEGPPLLFETMIFGGEEDGYMVRCSTYEEALKQHKETCEMLKN